MKSVFIVLHERKKDEDNEDVKMIGAYSSEATAKAAVARVIKQPGFRDYPDGFSIDEYEIDEDNWTEGFGGPDPD